MDGCITQPMSVFFNDKLICVFFIRRDMFVTLSILSNSKYLLFDK